jgi:uncharacterized protein YfaQ (DUF2300 family)
MLAELSNLHGVVIGASIPVGALIVGAVAWWSWPGEPKWLRDLERWDQERREARRVLVGDRARREPADNNEEN